MYVFVYIPKKLQLPAASVYFVARVAHINMLIWNLIEVFALTFNICPFLVLLQACKAHFYSHSVIPAWKNRYFNFCCLTRFFV